MVKDRKAHGLQPWRTSLKVAFDCTDGVGSLRWRSETEVVAVAARVVDPKRAMRNCADTGRK